MLHASLASALLVVDARVAVLSVAARVRAMAMDSLFIMAFIVFYKLFGYLHSPPQYYYYPPFGGQFPPQGYPQGGAPAPGRRPPRFPRRSRNPRPDRSNDPLSKTRLFVANIPFSMTSEQLAAEFAQFGVKVWQQPFFSPLHTACTVVGGPHRYSSSERLLSWLRLH